MKLQILVLLADESNITTILNEFTAYTKVLDPALRKQVVSSIGDCARKVPKVQSACLQTLINLLDAYNEGQPILNVETATHTDYVTSRRGDCWTAARDHPDTAIPYGNQRRDTPIAGRNTHTIPGGPIRQSQLDNRTVQVHLGCFSFAQ